MHAVPPERPALEIRARFVETRWHHCCFKGHSQQKQAQACPHGMAQSVAVRRSPACEQRRVHRASSLRAAHHSQKLSERSSLLSHALPSPLIMR
jgi:hypothetical protein